MAKSDLIGRHRERELIHEMLASGRPELVALYGRRRVGKTHLVRELMKSEPGTYFEVTGTRNGSAAVQRKHFREAVEATFLERHPLPELVNWEHALSYLADLVEQRAAERPQHRVVLFFDELPWLAAPRSRLLDSIEHIWNARLSKLPQVKFILCGSAASWMLQRLVHAKGGLHNRITRQIRLEPFSLRETDAYLRANRILMKPRELLELYMAFGGVPYYLSLVERGHSVAEIVGRLCFEQSGRLRTEFYDVFASLFENHDEHVAILRELARRKSGLTRNELIEASRVSSGGGLNRRLQELEEAGFIARIDPWGARVKNTLFRVIDEYTLFFLKWIERAPKGILSRGASAYWTSKMQTPGYAAWTGYAFESLCLKHASEIQRALGIQNLVNEIGTWRWVPRTTSSDRRGAQVDLLFDRRDDVINLCEIKFSGEPFVVTKAYARELGDKVALFEEHTKTKKRVILTLITPIGLKRNVWSEDLIERVVDSTALFG